MNKGYTQGKGDTRAFTAAIEPAGNYTFNFTERNQALL